MSTRKRTVNGDVNSFKLFLQCEESTYWKQKKVNTNELMQISSNCLSLFFLAQLVNHEIICENEPLGAQSCEKKESNSLDFKPA